MKWLEIRCDTLLRWCLLAFSAVVLVLSVFSKRGWIDWMRINRRNQELLASIEVAKQQQQSLIEQNDRAKNDKREQELLVRSTLGYLAPNEFLVEFED